MLGAVVSPLYICIYVFVVVCVVCLFVVVVFLLCVSPGFLDRMKALVGWLRDNSVVKHLQRKLRDVGKPGAAALLATLSVASIAEWRWHTLGDTTAALAPVLTTIALSFERAWFEILADQSRLQRVCNALQSADWMTQFRFVNEFMERNQSAHSMDWRVPVPQQQEGAMHEARAQTTPGAGIRIERVDVLA